MLESYFQEVKRKQMRKLFFWLIVFIFASLLYLFFKGTYIVVNFDWINRLEDNPQITSSGLTNSWGNFITLNHFGIVNVKTFPRDATMLLNGEYYRNDSKPQIDYNNYEMWVFKNGYKNADLNFSITDEKNFFIDTVYLLKNPTYSRTKNIVDGRIIPIWSDSWIAYAHSGMLLYQNTFESGTLISPIQYKHMGDEQFLIGKTPATYSILDGKWIKNPVKSVENFISKCPNPSYQNMIFTCSENHTAITNAGKTFTGVLSYGKNFLKTNTSIILRDSGEDTVIFPLTEASKKGNYFLEIEHNWFTNSGSALVSIDPENPEILDESEYLDVITFVQKIGKNIFFIGEKDGKKWLIQYDTHLQSKPNILDIPDNVELADIRFYERFGNIFLKTRNSLLFFYQFSQKIDWLIDGKILAVGADFAIYETNNEIWIADWKDKAER